MIIRQLAHLCFFTHQLDVMVAFYRDKLGFPIAFTMHNDDGFQFGYYFELGNATYIEIFDQAGAVKLWGGDAVPQKPNEGVYYGHFCLEVLGLDETCVELRARGVEILRPIKIGIDHSRQAWIKDPDGNLIELMEYTAKSLQLTDGVQGKHVPIPRSVGGILPIEKRPGSPALPLYISLDCFRARLGPARRPG